MDRNGMVASPSGGVFNHRIDRKLQIMERLGDMTGAASSEIFRVSLAADGREIYFLSL